MLGSNIKLLTSFSAALSLVLGLSGCTSTATPLEPLASIQLQSPGTSTPATDDGEVIEVSPGSDDEVAVTATPVTDDLAELEIEDQSGLGYEVIIEEVRLSLGDGFLVIMNQAGEILGYSLVTPDSQPVLVSLTIQATNSQELTGKLFLDNGDGVFSRESDFQMMHEEEEFVEEQFSYSLSR